MLEKWRNDAADNSATIEHSMRSGYKGAPGRRDLYRLTVKADYDHGFVFFVSCYETLEEARERLFHMGGETSWRKFG